LIVDQHVGPPAPVGLYGHRIVEEGLSGQPVVQVQPLAVTEGGQPLIQGWIRGDDRRVDGADQAGVVPYGRDRD
jgi:hypothetical protein